MGFRFRKSIRILPGVRLNLSRTGVSASLGRPGATINVGRSGVRGTVGIPGSGLSYSEMLMRRQTGGGEGQGQGSAGKAFWTSILFVLLFIGAIATCMHGGEPDKKRAEVQAEPIARTPLPTAYVTVDRLNCRSGPAIAAPVLASYARAQAVRVIAAAGEWTQVERPGASCWVASRLLSGAPPSVMPASAAPLRTAPPRAARSSASATGSCSCAGGQVCTGPRGGRYCLTSGGSKRYGV